MLALESAESLLTLRRSANIRPSLCGVKHNLPSQRSRMWMSGALIVLFCFPTLQLGAAETSYQFPPGLYAQFQMKQRLSPAVVRTLKAAGFTGIVLTATWSNIENVEDRPDWLPLDQQISRAKESGFKVALNLIESPYYAPGWLKDDSRVKTRIRLVRSKAQESTFGPCGTLLDAPVFWDPFFHERRCIFLKAAGQRYSQDPNIVAVSAGVANFYFNEMNIPAFVGVLDCTSAGKGVMRLNQVSDWLRAGYTTDKMFEAAKGIISTIGDAFPRQNIKIMINITNPKLDGSNWALAEAILTYGYQRFPLRFYAQSNSLRATDPAPGSPAYQEAAINSRRYHLHILKRYSPQIGFQMFAPATDGEKNGCPQNRGLSPCPDLPMLQASFAAGFAYRPTYIEVSYEDSLNPGFTEALSVANHHLVMTR